MKKLRKACITIFVSLLLLFLAINEGAFSEEADPGPCEVALYRCIFDRMNLGTSEGAFHCLLGYVFCKKYVEGI